MLVDGGEDDATMHAAATVNIRPLTPTDHPTVRRIVATAFAGEPFAFGMFGESPLDRLVGTLQQYASWPDSPELLALVAEHDGVLLSVATATPPGRCWLCDEFDPAAAPGDGPGDAIDHEFHRRCREAHLGSALPPHARITTVATDTFLAGAGIGGRLVRELAAQVFAGGATCAVLECLTAREAFYGRCGFRRVVEFDDPGAPGLRALLMRADRSS